MPRLPVQNLKVSQFPFRAWVNQPSTLQPLHHLNGTNVLAVHEYDDTYSIFFLSGDVSSQQCSGLCLSKGWNQPTERESWNKINLL